MKASDLKALQPDLEGRLLLEGKPVRVVPIGRPDIVFTDKRTRNEGCLHYGRYGHFEETVKIPEGADSYVIGTRASSDYAPIQFYKIVKSTGQQRSKYSKKGKISEVPAQSIPIVRTTSPYHGITGSGEWEHWENEL